MENFLTADELSDIHLALIHRANRIINDILPIIKDKEQDTYKAELERLNALRQKVCKMSLEASLGFSLS
jgi:hypothetical protein